MVQQNAHNNIRPPTRLGGIVGVVFGLVFFAIGITVMVAVWGADDGFHQPPLFFRIFATLIAIPFVAMGGAVAYGCFNALRTGQDSASLSTHTPRNSHRTESKQVEYDCPNCGAPISRGADVSPHGDVKCSHCGNWFNIRRSSQN
jgi:predicted RNA-binding Zn-ribbon protein involved in translation (DUF1610 family)